MNDASITYIIILAASLGIAVTFVQPLTVERYQITGKISEEIGPEARLTDEYIDFGSKKPSMNMARTVSVTNKGDSLHQYSIDIEGNISPFISAHPSRGTLSSKESAKVVLTFDGTEPGFYQGDLVINQRNVLPLVRKNK